MKESTHTKKIHDVLISSVDLVFNNLELLLEDFAGDSVRTILKTKDSDLAS